VANSDNKLWSQAARFGWERVYRWYICPGLHAQTGGEYRHLLGTATFTVR
jgi:hypothetical protein